jgi:AcrR family transcriptional regulator
MATGPTVPDTRERILTEARRAFAAKGFLQASTREICKAAKTQVGLIAYYFGDKAGLYRTILVEPLAAMMESLPMPDETASLSTWLRTYYRAFLEPLVSGNEPAKDLMRIFGREITDRTPVFEQAYLEYIVPQHQALARMLAERVGASEVDAQIDQLTLAVAALVNDYWISGDHVQALAPGLLLKDSEAFDRVLDRLVAYGQALIRCEHDLRQQSLSPAA